MRNPETVELGREPGQLELELAQPDPAGFEPAIGDRQGRERCSAREDAGARQIWSFSRIGLTETTWRLNFSSDSSNPAATPTSCDRCRIGIA